VRRRSASRQCEMWRPLSGPGPRDGLSSDRPITKAMRFKLFKAFARSVDANNAKAAESGVQSDTALLSLQTGPLKNLAVRWANANFLMALKPSVMMSTGTLGGRR